MAEPQFGQSLFQKSIRKFRRDKFGLAGLATVLIFAVVAVGVKLDLFCGRKAATTVVGPQFVRPGALYDKITPPPPGAPDDAPPVTVKARSLFGTDIAGIDVFTKLV